MVVVSILLHAEFGPNDHREGAPHFTFYKRFRYFWYLTFAGNWEWINKSFWDIIRISGWVDCHWDPSTVWTTDPVSQVITNSFSCGHGAGKFSGFQNGCTTFLNFQNQVLCPLILGQKWTRTRSHTYLDSGNEITLEPSVIIDTFCCWFAVDSCLPGIWILSCWVVTPDCDFLKLHLDIWYIHMYIIYALL